MTRTTKPCMCRLVSPIQYPALDSCNTPFAATHHKVAVLRCFRAQLCLKEMGIIDRLDAFGAHGNSLLWLLHALQLCSCL